MKRTGAKILSGVLKAGRATATLMGVAVMVALVVGAGTTALAAVPGDPLKLGESNRVAAATELVGKNDGATLTVEHVFDTVKNVPALALKVPANDPPLTVNAEAGTASNLSADKLDGMTSAQFALAAGGSQAGKAADSELLDGKDSTAFAGGTNGKANDADKLDGVDSSGFLRTNGKAADADNLDGKDSSAFLGPRFYTVKGSEGLVGTGGGQLKNRSATCDSGDLAIGGFYDTQPGDVVFETYTFPGLIGSSGSSFAINVQDNGAGNLMSATAVCADNPPFH
jgi:hypothetical protein